jgi:hypothetical protein
MQLFDRHADVAENPTECSLGGVASMMDRHGGAATVGMAHDVMATRDPRDLETGSL